MIHEYINDLINYIRGIQRDVLLINTLLDKCWLMFMNKLNIKNNI